LKKLLKITALLASVLLASLLYSCKPEKEGGENEGVIEFDTKAIDQTHPLSGLAPGSAVLKYKNDKFIMEMSTMGMFNTSIIGNTTEKTMTQTVRFMDLKQFCTDNFDEIQKENEAYQLNIEETSETKKILGYKCHKLKVNMVNNPSITFDAWYTKDLGMENCNALTPYSKVKGVLMDYRAKKMGLEMRFLVKSIKHVAVPDETFEIPESLKPVSKAEMSKFFADLQ